MLGSGREEGVYHPVVKLVVVIANSQAQFSHRILSPSHHHQPALSLSGALSTSAPCRACYEVLLSLLFRHNHANQPFDTKYLILDLTGLALRRDIYRQPKSNGVTIRICGVRSASFVPAGDAATSTKIEVPKKQLPEGTK